MIDLQTSLDSKRLAIQPLKLEDCDEIYACITPSLTRFMAWEPASSFEEFVKIAQSWIQARSNQTDQHFVLRDKQNQQFIGLIGVHQINSATPELGLWVREDQHGRGYAKEALSQVVDWASLVNPDYFIYPVASENIASRKLAEGLAGKVVEQKQLKKYLQVIYHVPAAFKQSS